MLGLEAYKIVLMLTVGFSFACFFGYISQRLKISPILGYLIAGYIIGPYSPGFEADAVLSEQLSEIGVILMMFGVGLNFRWQDLLLVKNISIPGAICQTLVSASLGALVIYQLGWGIEAGIIYGLAIGVASTVMLVRVLTDNNLIQTPEGRIAVGWLIVEDIFTVFALLLIPSLASSYNGEEFSFLELSTSIGVTLVKFLTLAMIMFTFGKKLTVYLLSKIVKAKSHELFTIAVLALTFVIATGSALLFGTSIALGAFIAGMVIGQSEVRNKVSSNALPLKEVFVVLFFLAVGMLFNPQAVMDHFSLFVKTLLIILVGKPIAAFVITLLLGYPYRTAFLMAIALAQIGEFSFILTQEAMNVHILPDEGYDVIVACALISISLNPILFKLLPSLETKGKKITSASDH